MVEGEVAFFKRSTRRPFCLCFVEIYKISKIFNYLYCNLRLLTVTFALNLVLRSFYLFNRKLFATPTTYIRRLFPVVIKTVMQEPNEYLLKLDYMFIQLLKQICVIQISSRIIIC